MKTLLKELISKLCFYLDFDDGTTIYDYEFPETAVEGTTICHNVSIMDNKIIGDRVMRTFTLDVVNSNDVGHTTTHTITITDDDGRNWL